MPLLKNAKKALRSSQAKAVANRRIKSRTKSALDAVRSKPDSATMARAYSSLDRAAKKKIFHPNKVARLKRQVSRLVAA